MALRAFIVNGQTYALVESPEVRRRDIRNRTITVKDPEQDTVYCFYQGHDIQSRISELPLSVRIYTTARQILEAMLRAAISDAEISGAFDFQSGEAPAGNSKTPLRLNVRKKPAAAVGGGDGVCAYEFHGETLVLRVVTKEFKMAEARKYAELVFDELKPRIKRLVLDIGEVTYMNSSGISVLARSSAEFPFKIANVTENVRNVMDIMGLLSVIDIYDTAADAINAFEQTR
ncbi:MAG: STAS domain-containing protein [Planctomycetota bacterium]|jgi:anti-anti-sigma factor